MEYRCFPVWIIDDDGGLIGDKMPEDFENDAEMVSLFNTIQKTYEGLFVNNSKEFSFRGFATEEQKAEFLQMFWRACEMLKQKSEGLYNVIIYDRKWIDDLAEPGVLL